MPIPLYEKARIKTPPPLPPHPYPVCVLLPPIKTPSTPPIRAGTVHVCFAPLSATTPTTDLTA